MKKRKIKIFSPVLIILIQLSLLNILFPQFINAANRMHSNKDVLIIDSFDKIESEYNPGNFIKTVIKEKDNKKYNGGFLKDSKAYKRRMYTFISNFYLNERLSKEDISLYISPRDYPYNVYVNGNLLYKKGQYSKDYNSIQYETSNIFMPPSVLHYGKKKNTIAVQIYPQEETQPFEEVMVLSNKTGTEKKFWRNMLNIHLIQATYIIGLLLGLFLLIIGIGANTKKIDYIYFSLMCFSYCLAYSNLFFHFDYNNELLFEIISRCGFPITTMFLLLFTLEFTGLMNRRLLVKFIVIIPVILVSIITIFQTSKEGVRTVFLYTIHLIIMPHLIFSIFIIFLSITRYKNKGLGKIIVLFSIFSVILTGMYDIYFVINNIFPYCWMTPYGYLTLVLGIFCAIASERYFIYSKNFSLTSEIFNTQKEIIYTLGEVVEKRSKETAFHVKRVAEVSYILAKYLRLDDNTINMFRLASPMHDIGKIGISDIILNKPDRLTEDEFQIIKTHTTIGHQILKKSGRDILKMASTIALEHHERWDGKGYPRGIRGNDINILGRISAIADNFDALTHNRVYKEAWELEKVLHYFKEQRGRQFDPVIMGVFLGHIDDFIEVNRKYPD